MSNLPPTDAPPASPIAPPRPGARAVADPVIAAISARSLSKAFGSRRALRPLTLELSPGESLAIVGPNGAGKSTLVRMLATLSRPTTGDLMICGFSAAREAQEARRHIGAVLHDSMLYPDLTVAENLRFFGRLYGVADVETRGREVQELLDLRRLAGTRVRHLSHGQRQRASIARATVHDPDVLILDEPDAGLDTASFERLRILLTATRRRTLVLTTHQPAHALVLGQRLLLLREGRASDLGATERWSVTDLSQAILAAGH